MGRKIHVGPEIHGHPAHTYLIGRDGKIAQVWEKVRVPGHAEEVLEAAKAL